jgi:hypothetical protein
MFLSAERLGTSDSFQDAGLSIQGFQKRTPLLQNFNVYLILQQETTYQPQAVPCPRRLVAGGRFPIAANWFDSKSDHVRFVVNKVALGHVLCEYLLILIPFLLVS